MQDNNHLPTVFKMVKEMAEKLPDPPRRLILAEIEKLEDCVVNGRPPRIMFLPGQSQLILGLL